MAQLFKDKTLFIFALAAFTFVVLANVGGFRSYSPVPFWDMWNGYLDFYVKASAGDLSVWWAQHNEHRIFIARLFFWLDFTFFHGQVWFLFAVNYLLMGVVCLIFWNIWKERTTGNIPWIGFFLIAWLFSWIQEENLNWAFQSQFILAQLLPLAALYFLHRAATPGMFQNRDFYIAILFGALALGSMANGVLTLPLMTLYAAVVRMGLKRSLLLAILALVAISLYFYDYKAQVHHGSL
jgi:hypothetical protein